MIWCGRRVRAFAIVGMTTLTIAGCLARREPAHIDSRLPRDYTETALEIEYPDVEPADYTDVGGLADPRPYATTPR